MTNSDIPDGALAELEFSGEKIRNFLGIYNYDYQVAVVERLIEKDVNLDPVQLQRLFGKVTQLSLVQRFKTLTSVMEDLRQQGIYIPYILDEYGMDEGIINIKKSSIHPLGLIPITSHNKVNRWWWRREKNDVQLTLQRVKETTAVAMEIHESFNGHKGWVPWNPMMVGCPFHILANKMAVQQRYNQDLQLMEMEEFLS